MQDHRAEEEDGGRYCGDTPGGSADDQRHQDQEYGQHDHGVVPNHDGQDGAAGGRIRTRSFRTREPRVGSPFQAHSTRSQPAIAQARRKATNESLR